MEGQEFSGESLVKALEGESLAPKSPAGLTLIGMVKLSKEPGCVSFTPGGCDTWVDIPTRLIEKAVQLGERRCDDHTHPAFRIALKEPADAEGKLLGKLLMASSRGWRGDLPLSLGDITAPRTSGGDLFGSSLGPVSARINCDQKCQALLRSCIESTPFSSATCVFLYSNCFHLCQLFGPLIDIFTSLERQRR